MAGIGERVKKFYKLLEAGDYDVAHDFLHLQTRK